MNLVQAIAKTALIQHTASLANQEPTSKTIIAFKDACPDIFYLMECANPVIVIVKHVRMINNSVLVALQTFLYKKENVSIIVRKVLSQM